MGSQFYTEVESVAWILLCVSERVVEVSKDHIMTRIWDREGSELSKFRQLYEGKSIRQIRNDSTIAYCEEALNKAFETGADSYTEYISHNNDVDAVVRYSLRILNCHPIPDFVFLLIENITRGDETDLIEDRWKMALDASEQGVWDVNLDAGTIFFSQKWEDLFGYSAREVERTADWSEKVLPEDREAAEARMKDYLEGRSPFYSAEMRYRCKDGIYKWIMSRGVVIARNADGSPRRFIGTHTDISELKQTQEELRQAKETFSNIFNYSAIPKALIAPGGNWLEVNQALCDITGYTREELCAMHYRDITFPADLDIDRELIQALIENRSNSYTVEKRYVAKDRRLIITSLTVTLVRNEHGAPRYFICDIMDITHLRETDELLKRKNFELEATSINLMKKINQMDELNRIVAHNLRGPAGNIMMIASGPDIFTTDEALTMIRESSESLLQNLETLLEMTTLKIDEEIAWEECDFETKVKLVSKQLQGVIFQNGITIETDFEVPGIRYPRIYLESIVYNLISNAIKYRRTDIPCIISVRTRMVDGRATLIVKDNGIGIDMERYGDKVFKLNQIFHKGYDSKGVGLFMTKTQIESFGGTIKVESKPDEGCCFTITF